MSGIEHYENFPVASWLCPSELRPAIVALYHFARTADDLADEGDATPEQRLKDLAEFRADLNQALNPETSGSANSMRWPHVFAALARVAAQHQLPHALLHDLLDAFEQDVAYTSVGKGYRDTAELLDYCRRSANPVGRLLLHLYGVHDTTSLTQSDAICTALQLINFWQDVAIDWRKGRIYLPQDEMARFGVTETTIATSNNNAAWQALMQFQVDRTRALLNSGAALGSRLEGRIGFELRMIIQGGLCILHKIETVQYDVFYHRPTLRAADWVRIFWRALLNR